MRRSPSGSSRQPEVRRHRDHPVGPADHADDRDTHADHDRVFRKVSTHVASETREGGGDVVHAAPTAGKVHAHVLEHFAAETDGRRGQ